MSDRTAHRWTDEDDAALEAAVLALASGLPPKADLWSAVVGRLAPELLVTPQAARSRYGRIVEARQEAARQQARAEAQEEIARVESQRPDAWQAISQRIEELEQEQADRIEETVRRIYEEQEAISARLVAIEAGLLRLLGMWV
jgi:hypothetical protein